MMIGMTYFLKLTAFVAATAFVVEGQSETHTVTFQNLCSTGVPTLKTYNGEILSTGPAYTSNGSLIAAIAYLDVGCGAKGEGCTLIETTLVNPASPGTGSSTDINLIPPHSFSVPSGFGYYNGCDGHGANCTDADCPSAFHSSTEGGVGIVCLAENVNLAITFCN
ncbi:glycopeptide [Lentinula edodes]|nr:glycopeptide [Lentinula edodes]